MRISFFLMLVGSLGSGQAWAQACDVISRSSSDAVTPLERHTCYSYSNMPAEAIDWSCSNGNKEMVNSQKQKVQSCASGSIGTCIAPLTQESLANPKSTGRDITTGRPPVANNAQVITHYYATTNLAQARTDCERGDGTWKTQ